MNQTVGTRTTSAIAQSTAAPAPNRVNQRVLVLLADNVTGAGSDSFGCHTAPLAACPGAFDVTSPGRRTPIWIENTLSSVSLMRCSIALMSSPRGLPSSCCASSLSLNDSSPRLKSTVPENVKLVLANDREREIVKFWNGPWSPAISCKIATGARTENHQQHERDDAHSAAQVVFTMSKLQGRWWLTLLGTEPSRRKRVTPVMPRLPITTRS